VKTYIEFDEGAGVSLSKVTFTDKWRMSFSINNGEEVLNVDVPTNLLHAIRAAIGNSGQTEQQAAFEELKLSATKLFEAAPDQKLRVLVVNNVNGADQVIGQVAPEQLQPQGA